MLVRLQGADKIPAPEDLFQRATPEPMTDFYQQNAKTYFAQTAWVDPEAFLRPFLKHLPAPARVLVVGCGSGRDLVWLKAHGYSAIGLERSPALAELARAHAGCEVIEADFETWDFGLMPVDGMLLVGALVHVQYEMFEEMVTRLTAGLISSGRMLISLKEGYGVSRGADGRKFFLWRDEKLRKHFEYMGLRVLHFERSTSAVRADDIWLTYVLEKGSRG